MEIWVEGEPDVLGVNVVDADGATYFAVVEPWAASAHDGGGAGPDHAGAGDGHARRGRASATRSRRVQTLVVLEAMKMEHSISADADGTVDRDARERRPERRRPHRRAAVVVREASS